MVFTDEQTEVIRQAGSEASALALDHIMEQCAEAECFHEDPNGQEMLNQIPDMLYHD